MSKTSHQTQNLKNSSSSSASQAPSSHPSIISHIFNFVNKNIITPIKNFINPPTIIRITHAPGSSAPLKTPIIKNATLANQKLLKSLEQKNRPSSKSSFKPLKAFSFSDLKSKPALVITVSLITIFVSTTIFYLNFSNRSATLDLLVAPTTATVKIGSKTFTSGTHHLKPGNYTVEISHPEFESKSTSITLSKDSTTPLYLALSPKDPDWFNSRPEEAMNLNAIGDRLADQAAKDYQQKYPIIKDLPILHAEYSKDYTTYTEYRIDGGDFSKDQATPCPRDFCLKITDTTGGNRAAAIDHLRSLGYRPEDYHILYQFTPITPLD